MFERIRALLNAHQAAITPDADGPTSVEPAAVETSVLIHRLDGTTEDLGIVCASYRDPRQQAAWETTGRARAADRINTANTRPKGA